MAQRRYETLVVMHPDLGDPGARDLATKIKGIIEAQDGSSIMQVLEWGTRELAYLVDKQRRGIYMLFEYKISAAGLAEVERQLRIMDPVLRHISVRQDEDAPLATAPRPPRPFDADEAPADGAAATPASEPEAEAAPAESEGL